MPKAIEDKPTSRSSWQWEKLKAHLEEEYHNPAKFDANCKVNSRTNASLQLNRTVWKIGKVRAAAAVLLSLNPATAAAAPTAAASTLHGGCRLL
jgi:hypothetical protein